MSSKKKEKHVTPENLLHVYYHPQRGVIATQQALNVAWDRHRGGDDSDWEVLPDLRCYSTYPFPTFVPGQSLRKGFLFGNTAKQKFGWGGWALIFGPLHRTCRDCNKHFIFTAEEHRKRSEEQGFSVEAVAIRCEICGPKRRELERKRRAWSNALSKAEASPSLDAHLKVVEAAMNLLDVGGLVAKEKVLPHLAKLKKLGASNVENLKTEFLEKTKK